MRQRGRPHMSSCCIAALLADCSAVPHGILCVKIVGSLLALCVSTALPTQVHMTAALALQQQQQWLSQNTRGSCSSPAAVLSKPVLPTPQGDGVWAAWRGSGGAMPVSAAVQAAGDPAGGCRPAVT
jgi:hypothetical protein